MNLVVFAGPNGSGKSTIVNEFLSVCPLWYICPDNYAKNYDHIASTKDRYILAMQEAEKDRNTALESGDSFAMETVFSTKGKLEFIQRAIGFGYTVEVFFVTTSDPKINIRRVAKRREQGGHDVPEDKIKDRFNKNMNFLHQIIQIAHVVTVVDNSVDESTPIYVFKKEYDQAYFLNTDICHEWCQHFIVEPLKATPFWEMLKINHLNSKETVDFLQS